MTQVRESCQLWVLSSWPRLDVYSRHARTAKSEVVHKFTTDYRVDDLVWTNEGTYIAHMETKNSSSIKNLTSCKFTHNSQMCAFNLTFAQCKGIQILESGKILFVESWILVFGIRNPTNDWNPDPIFTDKDWNPAPGSRIRGAESRNQDFFDYLTWGD